MARQESISLRMKPRRAIAVDKSAHHSFTLTRHRTSLLALQYKAILPSDSANPLRRKEFKMIQRGKIILVRHLLIVSFLVVTAIPEAFAQSVATPQKTERAALPTRD